MTDQQIYQKVSKQLGVSVDKVAAYDKAQWNQIKMMLNNPCFDVLEVPMLCTWVVIPSRMNSTLKYSIRVMRKYKRALAEKPNSERTKAAFEDSKRLFKELWKLKKECKMIK